MRGNFHITLTLTPTLHPNLSRREREFRVGPLVPSRGTEERQRRPGSFASRPDSRLRARALPRSFISGPKAKPATGTGVLDEMGGPHIEPSDDRFNPSMSLLLGSAPTFMEATSPSLESINVGIPAYAVFGGVSGFVVDYSPWQISEFVAKFGTDFVEGRGDLFTGNRTTRPRNPPTRAGCLKHIRVERRIAYVFGHNIFLSNAAHSEWPLARDIVDEEANLCGGPDARHRGRTGP